MKAFALDADGESLFASITLSPIASVISNPRLPGNPIVAVNAGFCALTGYPTDEIIGRNCKFLGGPGTEPWLTERIATAIRAHKPVLVEILNYKRDRTPFRNAVLVAPVFDATGALEYFLGSQVELDDDTVGPLSARHARAAELVRTLSPRQREVLNHMACGRRSKSIAWEMHLSEKTVKMHRSLVLDKLGIANLADAVRIAVEAGL